MERLLNIATFRHTHEIPVGKKVPLKGKILCKPNYRADEVEFVQYAKPEHTKRKDYSKINVKALSKHLDMDFRERIIECCSLYADDAQAETIADTVIDVICGYRWSDSVEPTLTDFLTRVFTMYGISSPNPTDRVSEWKQVLSGSYEPSERRIADALTSVVRYKGSHIRHIIIPTKIAQQLDWERKTIGLYERNGKYIAMPAREHDYAFKRRAGIITKKEGRVNLGRYLYLTKEQRSILGFNEDYFSEGYFVKMTVDLTGDSVLTYTLATEEDKKSIITFSDALKAAGHKAFYRKKQTVLTRVVNCIILPAAFSKQEQLQNDDWVETEIKGQTLYVYGRPSMCEFTGDHINKKRDKDISVPVCADCNAQIDSVRKRIHKSGNINKAIKNAKAELESVLRDIETYERNH